MRDYGDDWRREDDGRQEPWGGQQAWTPAPSREPPAENDGYPPPRTQRPRDPWNPQGSVPPVAPAALPRTISRREPTRDPRYLAQEEPGAPRRAAPAAAPPTASRPRSARRSAVIGPLLVLIVVPLLGAAASGPALGLPFTVAAVAAGLGAALLATPNGLWWIVPCTPTALLVAAFAWSGADGLNNAKTTVAAATALFQGVAGAFPGVAAGTVAALVVAAVRVARGSAETRRQRV